MNLLYLKMIAIAVTALKRKKVARTIAPGGTNLGGHSIAIITAIIHAVMPVNIPGATVTNSQRIRYVMAPTVSSNSSSHSGQMGFVKFLTL